MRSVSISGVRPFSIVDVTGQTRSSQTPQQPFGRTTEEATGLHVTLSSAAQELLEQQSTEAPEPVSSLSEDNTQDVFVEKEASGEETEENPDEASKDNPQKLTEEEVLVVEELKRRDVEVRAHEMAHMAAGGGLTSGPHYDYQTGPDNKRYAIGGHVNIDTSEASTPEQTVMKARQIRSAALAPVSPSPQDRAVASQAGQMEQSAQAEILQKKVEEQSRAAEAAKSGINGLSQSSEQESQQSEQAEDANGLNNSEADQDLKVSALGRRAMKAYAAFENIGSSWQQSV